MSPCRVIGTARKRPIDAATQPYLTRFSVGKSGDVSALVTRPRDARCVLVYGHGAGADMRHAFHADLAEALARRRIGTFRYNFPYTEAGRRRPDRTSVLTSTVRSAVQAAAEEAGGLPLLGGGKSMGGRMTSTAASETPLPGVRGLVFFGFPLHRPGETSTARAEHLDRVTVPLLFLQGARDRLADISLIQIVCRKLRGRVTLHVVEDADHSFHLPRRTGRSAADVSDELAGAVETWTEGLGL